MHALNLLKLAIDKNFKKKLEVIGDSKLVIEWIHGTYRLQNLTLGPILDQILNAVLLFEEISFKHVYRQFNFEADKLSKEAISGPTGLLQVAEADPPIS
jgi:hypothetical protein